MKKNTIPACAALVLALVIAIGSQTFLGACVHEDGSFGACHWASRALMGEGLLLAVLAVLALALPNKRGGLYLSMLPAAALGMLTPGTLIDICKMDTMRCRMVMRPAMLILLALVLVAALAGLLLSRAEGNKR